MTVTEVGTRAPRLLIDAREYAQRVLLQGAEIPWEPAAHARLLAQVGAMLRPDPTLVELTAFGCGGTERRPALRERFTGARRATAGLRALLADETLAADAVELVRVVAATSARPVAVQILSPAAWLSDLAPAARDSAFDADDAENASVYLADWVRRFAELPVDTLVLDGRQAPGGEEPGGEALAGEALGAYGPLVGVTEHYRWTLALRGEDHLDLAAGGGGVLDARFWAGSPVEVPQDAALVLSRIDPGAEPEEVLAARTRWG